MMVDSAARRAVVAMLLAWRRRRLPPDFLVASERTSGIIYAGSASKKRVVFTTTQSWVDFLLAADIDLSELEVFARPGVLVSSYASLVRREAAANKSSISFIGDLDPATVAVYVSLLNAGLDAVPGSRPLDVDYVGLGDAECQGSRRRPQQSRR